MGVLYDLPYNETEICTEKRGVRNAVWATPGLTWVAHSPIPFSRERGRSNTFAYREGSLFFFFRGISRTSSATDPYTRWLGAPSYATTNHRQPVPNYMPHCAVAAGRGRGSPHAFWPQGYSRGPKPWVSARLQAASLSPLGCADMRETQRVQGAGGGYVAPIAPEGSAGVQGGVGYSPRRGAPPCPDGGRSLVEFLLGDAVLAALVGRRLARCVRDGR